VNVTVYATETDISTDKSDSL